MKYYVSWSGGKDSTATIILAHLHKIPIDGIVFSEVMFDKSRGISGELPEHIDFVKNKAIPIFEEWGFTTKIVRSEKDYLDLFNQVVAKSKIPERNGKKRGFLIGGMCIANDRLKLAPIKQFYRKFDLAGVEYGQYIGIAVDEIQRLKRLKASNKVSLLQEFSFTEKMAYDICKEYDLLSPTYNFSKRGGCWFCPNQGYVEFAYIKSKYPELWEELRRLDKEENVVSHGFKYGKTFSEVDARVDEILSRQNLFDLMGEKDEITYSM